MSGVFVLVQFFIFLVIGTAALRVLHRARAAAELTSPSPSAAASQTDRVLPQFIVSHLPTGLAGLVSAAILAAAMSSSLNASAAAAVADFYMPLTAAAGVRAALPERVARCVRSSSGCCRSLVALAAISLSRRVVDEVLGIASFTNGVILGVFLLGTFTVAVGRRGAFAGMAIGAP